MEFDLDQVRSALAKAEQQAGELRTVKREMKDLTNEMRRRDRELQGMADEKRRSDERAAQAEAAHRAEIATHHAGRRTARRADAQMAGAAGEPRRQLEQELEHERAPLRRAGRGAPHARATPGRCGGMALEAFNRSPHVDRVVSISRSLGDPLVNVAVDGCELPRAGVDLRRLGHLLVRVRGAARSLRADRSVEEARRGDDPRDLPAHRLHPNAVLRSDRVVLTMQAYGVGAASA